MLGNTYTIVDMAVWGWSRMIEKVISPGELEKRVHLKRLMDKINSGSASQRAENIAKKFDIHPVHLALAFCTKRPFMGSVIFGATTDEQLDVVIKGLDVDLSDEVMEEISLVYKNYALTF